MKVVFTYKALDERGMETRGTVDAQGKEDALRKLKELEVQGLRNIDIETANTIEEPPAGEAELPQRKSNPIVCWVVLGIALLLLMSFCRVYYGGGIGLRVVFKHSPSFKDTIVNLDDLIGQPYIVVMSNHPAVARQLEEMGIIKNPVTAVNEAIGEFTKKISEAVTDDTKISAAKADIHANISTALQLYELDNGAYPTTAEGLDALITRPASAQRWNGPYLNTRLIDPWGRPYRYESPGRHGGKYDLFSLGQDGVEGTADDIKSWK